MCGVFGFVAGPGHTPSALMLYHLAELNGERGKVGYGAFLWQREKSEVVVRGTEEFPQDLIDVAIQNGSMVAAYHVRAPTNGTDKDLRKLHPFSTPRLHLAHNGILLDWKTGSLYHRRATTFAGYPSQIDVDTLVILSCIEYHLERGLSLPAAISDMVKEVEGQQACWLWDSLTERLLLWRVMSTIYTAVVGGVAYFSSAYPGPKMLRGVYEFEFTALDQGYILALSPSTVGLKVQAEGHFEYKTPYGI